ncbi:MAG: aspartate--tRNA ligase [Bacillota bacterium]
MAEEMRAVEPGEPAGWRRTDGAGLLRPGDAGREVVLMGWVGRRRDHGGVAFIDLRDRSGSVQVVFGEALAAEAEELKPESVVAIRGTVALRPEGTVNRDIPTGEVEVRAAAVRLLNPARTPPVYTSELPAGPGAGSTAGETVRLRYRYLDLRRPSLQRNLALRHRLVKAVRDHLDEQGFWEIETPCLTRSTPEGARDYLVPARNAPGRFYALPQSPQLFKQLLMVAGVERYFQVARCFRDEDLRADRQPEFTQIDIEMSFVEPEDVMRLTEELMAGVWKEAVGVEVATPFPVLDYDRALLVYGSDKPDLRFGLEIADLTETAAGSAFRVLGEAGARGEVVRGLTVPGGAALYSRKDLDRLTQEVRVFGAQSLVWMAFEDSGLRSPAAKVLEETTVSALREALGARVGDLALLVAAAPETAAAALGHLRLQVGGRLGLRGGKDLRFVWVTNYPLFEAGEGPGRLAAKHHPFTAPVAADIDLLETDPARVRARAYDLVLNGWELGGGSIRNHRRDVQERVFRAMGLGPREYTEKFGFLLEALEYGAPPHGGIALGVDRIAALMAGEESIRDVIAFPKTASATCLLTGAPAVVEPEQLEELGLIVP